MFRIINILCLVFFIGGCAEANGDTITVVKHYEIRVPKGYILKNVKPPLADFDQVQISSAADASQKFDIYIGNHPSFPIFTWGADLPGSGSVLVEKLYSYRESDGAFEGLLIYTNISYNGYESPFSRLHYFGKGVRRASAAEFQKIVSSIKIVRPDLE